MNKNFTFKPKKSLGQNFLINPHIVRKITEACSLKSTDTILEIGPGKGALTDTLSAQCKRVIAIEKDRILAAQLQHRFDHTNTEIIHADILKYPFDTFPEKVKIIANLPYNIATPVIKKTIDHRMKFSSLFTTVQLEYGQRMAANPNTANYGAFSCFVQYYCDVQLLFKIKNSAFRPAPKVQSCFLHIHFLKKPKYQVSSEAYLFKIIHSCFGQRRKTIVNSLSQVIEKEKISEIFRKLHIEPKLRAENLSLKDYVRICNAAESSSNRG